MQGINAIYAFHLLEPRFGRLERFRQEELDRACLEAVGRVTPPKAQPKSDLIRLSPQQRRVLQLIAQGKLRKEIADELGISVKTVDNYAGQLYRVLNVHNKVEAARIVIHLQVVG